MQKARSTAKDQNKRTESATGDPMDGEAKVLVVDGHPIVGHGVVGLVDGEDDIVICGVATNACQALKAVKNLKPDLAVVEICLGGGLGGMGLVQEISSRFSEVPVLVFSGYDETVFAERMIRTGAKGYIMKHESPQRLLFAIRKVLKGDVYLSDSMSSRVLSLLHNKRSSEAEFRTWRLSNRELEVLELIGTGFSTREIGKMLHLSVKTIESHREHIKKKLSIKDAGTLLRYGIKWARGERKASL